MSLLTTAPYAARVHTLGPVALSRSAPAVAGVALVVGGCCVAAIDPAADGSPFPACAFHSMTGLWCPGCGLTRATHHLLRGDVAGAMSYNVLLVLALGAVAIGWLAWASQAWRGRRLSLLDRITPRVNVALATVVIAFGVVRNVPWAPLRALAP